MTPVNIKGARLRLEAQCSPQPLGSPLDPVVEWMQAHPKRVCMVLVAMILLVGLIEVPL